MLLLVNIMILWWIIFSYKVTGRSPSTFPGIIPKYLPKSTRLLNSFLVRADSRFFQACLAYFSSNAGLLASRQRMKKSLSKYFITSIKNKLSAFSLCHMLFWGQILLLLPVSSFLFPKYSCKLQYNSLLKQIEFLC